MLASTHFKIKRKKADDWFDPILNADTQLFVDPFLVFKEQTGIWAGAHDALVAHFERAFLLVAEGNRNPVSLQYRKALALLLFREPKELCLGYTAQGIDGLGSGLGFARAIAGAIADAIQRGLSHPRHFEELGILNKGLGRDRISDITCTILKRSLVSYTQVIAARHNLPVAAHRIYAATFDEQRRRWETPEVQVPTNPVTGGPLLFVPMRFLRDLPVLNADEWWENYENEKLREDVNYEILGHVSKDIILAAARANPEAVRQWTLAKEAETPKSYDFLSDPKGVWAWDAATAQYVLSNPLTLPAPTSDEQFFGVIDTVLRSYRRFIEEQGGWQLLWETGNRKEKPELAAQLLFRGLAQEHCRANNISLDAEVNLGRGPVDFKFSNGYQRRAHLEVKKVHNGKFWNGLSEQLPSYMASDDVSDGWFIAIRYRDTKSSKARAKELPLRVLAVGTEKGLNLRFGLIDATPKLSASRL